MIELRNITKSYTVNDGRKYVFDNVSLVIPDDTNVGIIGPNGAGKSTLLKLIAGAEYADSGEIICDKNMSWPLGMNRGFQGSLTGRQNIQFVCDINGLTRSQRDQVMERVIEFAEIGEYFDMPVQTYSSGMRSRLTFGLSISFKFDVYLIDELTSVGDRSFRKKAKEAFDNFKSKAQLVYVSHNLDNLKSSCESAVLVRNGDARFYPDIDEAVDLYEEHIAEVKKKRKRVKGK